LKVKYSVYFHQDGTYGGVEVHPPLPEDFYMAIGQQVSGLMREELGLPKDMRGIPAFYCNGREGRRGEGTHFIAVPSEEPMPLSDIKVAAQRVATLLREEGHEVAEVGHKSEWDMQEGDWLRKGKPK
jgi:hypothetical protein